MLSLLGPSLTPKTPDEITAVEAAQHMGISRGQASKRLNDLVDRGLATSRDCLIDGKRGKCWRVK